VRQGFRLLLIIAALGRSTNAKAQRPVKFEFVINLKTTKQIGPTIPQWTLMKADRVIK